MPQHDPTGGAAAGPTGAFGAGTATRRTEGTVMTPQTGPEATPSDETADVVARARKALEELRQAFEADDSRLCLRSAFAIEDLADLVPELIGCLNRAGGVS